MLKVIKFWKPQNVLISIAKLSYNFNTDIVPISYMNSSVYFMFSFIFFLLLTVYEFSPPASFDSKLTSETVSKASRDWPAQNPYVISIYVDGEMTKLNPAVASLSASSGALQESYDFRIRAMELFYCCMCYCWQLRNDFSLKRTCWVYLALLTIKHES